MEKIRNQMPKIIPLVKALTAAYLITGVSLLLLAFLLYRLQWDMGKIRIGIMIIYVVSCLIGGFLIGKLAGKRKFLQGMLLGAAYFVVLLIVSAWSGPVLSAGFSKILTSFIMCAASGMLGGMIS